MNRLRAVGIIVVFLLTAGIVLAQGGEIPREIPGEAVYIPFPVAITVDGALDDWAGIPAITVDRGRAISDDPAENGSFTFAVAADGENFYITMTMPDRNIITGQHGSETWNEDSLEFYLNLGGDRWATAYTDDIGQFRLIPGDIGQTDPAALTVGGTNADRFDVEGIVFAMEDGWGFEAAVPIGDRVTVAHGLEIGFQAHANGASELNRDVKLIWSNTDASDMSWTDPSVFGAGLFFEIGQTDVPEPSVYVEPVVEVDPMIREVAVNQVGYFPGATKLGVLQTQGNALARWALLDAETGDTIQRGYTPQAAFDEASGNFLQIADFSATTTPGSYVLQIDGVDSTPFVIADDIYRQLRVDAMAYFYHNRSGIPIEADYVGEDWARPAGHLSDQAVTCFRGEAADGTTWDGCDYTLDVSGGWYDAGDFGKYVVNGGISLWTLFNLYEHSPSLFPDGSLTIPENGNGVPDILDEARWEMEFLLAMQAPAGQPLAGMAHHKMHDLQWAGMPLVPPTEVDNDSGHADPTGGRYLYMPTTAATLNLAATAAQCARIWADIDADFSDRCLIAAESAWDAAINNDIILAGNVPGAGGGNYDDSTVSDEFFWAAAELFITTGQDVYRDYLLEAWNFTNFPGLEPTNSSAMYWGDTAALGTISLLTAPNDLGADDLAALQDQVVATADRYLQTIRTEGYGVPITVGEYYWGSNSSVLNNAIILALAYDITADPAYLDGVTQSMDYLLGHNALVQSFVTGYGARAPKHPHHRFWANLPGLGFPPPPPGVVVGGPNQEPDDPTALENAILDSGPAKRYVDMIGSWSTNEVTINWNAPLVWVAAYLDEVMSGG